MNPTHNFKMTSAQLLPINRLHSSRFPPTARFTPQRSTTTTITRLTTGVSQQKPVRSKPQITSTHRSQQPSLSNTSNYCNSWHLPSHRPGKQQLIFRSTSSPYRTVHHGVPQWSLVSPILFNFIRTISTTCATN